MLEQIDSTMFCQRMIGENTPEEFAFVINEMLNSGDAEDLALAVELMAFSSVIDPGYSMCAAIAFKKLVNSGEE